MTLLPLLLAVLMTPAAAEPGVSASELVIGSCSNLNGQPAASSKQLQGAQAYLAFVNEQGGVRGRKIRLIAHDDAYDSEKAVLCFRRLMDEGVFAGAFFTGSPTGVKYGQMAQANKLPVVGIASGLQRLRKPVNRYVLVLRASSADEEELVVGRLWDDLGIRKFGVLHQDDAYGVAVLRGVKRALKKRGAQPAVLGSFALKEDPSKAVEQVKAAGPEAVIVAAAAPETKAILAMARTAGWHPIFQASAAAAEAGPGGEGAVVTSVMPSLDRTDLPAVAAYRQRLKKYAPSDVPSAQGLEGYVNAVVLVEALKRAGPQPTREGLVDAVEALHGFDAGLGPDMKLGFSFEEHQGFSKVFAGVVREGKVVPLRDWKALRP